MISRLRGAAGRILPSWFQLEASWRSWLWVLPRWFEGDGLGSGVRRAGKRFEWIVWLLRHLCHYGWSNCWDRQVCKVCFRRLWGSTVISVTLINLRIARIFLIQTIKLGFPNMIPNENLGNGSLTLNLRMKFPALSVLKNRSTLISSFSLYNGTGAWVSPRDFPNSFLVWKPFGKHATKAHKWYFPVAASGRRMKRSSTIETVRLRRQERTPSVLSSAGFVEMFIPVIVFSKVPQSADREKIPGYRWGRWYKTTSLKSSAAEDFPMSVMPRTSSECELRIWILSSICALYLQSTSIHSFRETLASPKLTQQPVSDLVLILCFTGMMRFPDIYIKWTWNGHCVPIVIWNVDLNGRYSFDRAET